MTIANTPSSSDKRTTEYYISAPSYWPIIGSIAIFMTFVGAANWLHGAWFGTVLFFAGVLLLFYMMFGWFRDVVHETLSGLHSQQMDRSYVWSMVWFIVSEVMFFATFFGVLFYIRLVTLPNLGGEGGYTLTNYLLWPSFNASWPLLSNPDNYRFYGALDAMPAWGLPTINTIILLSSGVTITWAHFALKANRLAQLILGLIFTVLLGLIFLFLQAVEYHHAYTELGLQLSAGIYGSIFFMLTGFHGAHVTIGTVMLIVITIRAIKGHFTDYQHNHFAFDAVAWYWHFVDVVWVLLFIFVYWL